MVSHTLNALLISPQLSIITVKKRSYIIKNKYILRLIITPELVDILCTMKRVNYVSDRYVKRSGVSCSIWPVYAVNKFESSHQWISKRIKDAIDLHPFN